MWTYRYTLPSVQQMKTACSSRTLVSPCKSTRRPRRKTNIEFFHMSELPTKALQISWTYSTLPLIIHLVNYLQRICYCPGSQSPISHHGHTSSRPGQSTWDLWWTKWHWERFLPGILYDVTAALHSHPYVNCRMDKGLVRGPVSQRCNPAPYQQQTLPFAADPCPQAKSLSQCEIHTFTTVQDQANS